MFLSFFIWYGRNNNIGRTRCITLSVIGAIWCNLHYTIGGFSDTTNAECNLYNVLKYCLTTF